MARSRADLRSVDVDQVIADYEAETTVTAICATHRIGLTRLYRILDEHRIPRRRPNAPRLPKRLRERILADYAAGGEVPDIARRHRVPTSTVSSIATRAGITRNPRRDRDNIVGLIVRWLAGDDTLTYDVREAITRVGCRLALPGLRTIRHLDPAVVGDVKRLLCDQLLAGLDESV